MLARLARGDNLLAKLAFIKARGGSLLARLALLRLLAMLAHTLLRLLLLHHQRTQGLGW